MNPTPVLSTVEGIDTLITTYQTKLAQTQATAEQERQAQEAAALAQATALLTEKFGPLWPCVIIENANVHLEKFRGTHSVNLDALVDRCPCDLFVDLNGKIRLTIGIKSFHANDKPWDADDWGEFFTATRIYKAKQRQKRITLFCNSISYADNAEDVQQRLTNALAEFPDAHPHGNATWQSVADARLTELQQTAEDEAREQAERAAAAREYETRRQAAEREALAFTPFVAYQLHYSVYQPGNDEEPYPTQTAYSLNNAPDSDGWWQTISRGELTPNKFLYVARITKLTITGPDDSDAKYICKCDYDASVYIRRTPAGAQPLEKSV